MGYGTYLLAFTAIVVATWAGGMIDRGAVIGPVLLGLAAVLLGICTARLKRAALDVRDAFEVTKAFTVDDMRTLTHPLAADVPIFITGDTGMRPVRSFYGAVLGGRYTLILEGGDAVDV